MIIEHGTCRPLHMYTNTHTLTHTAMILILRHVILLRSTRIHRPYSRSKKSVVAE